MKKYVVIADVNGVGKSTCFPVIEFHIDNMAYIPYYKNIIY